MTVLPPVYRKKLIVTFNSCFQLQVLSGGSILRQIKIKPITLIAFIFLHTVRKAMPLSCRKLSRSSYQDATLITFPLETKLTRNRLKTLVPELYDSLPALSSWRSWLCSRQQIERSLVRIYAGEN